MNPGSILSLLFGCAMLQLICCYSDGSLLEEECQGMNINHGKPPQNSESPFTVDPENETFNDSYVGRNISVVLSTTSSPFNGFMLEAYECEGCKPAGTFSLTDPSSTVLLKCDGHSDRAVSHSNNFNKYSITVKWHVPAAGTFHFRAAFTQTFSVFWLRKPIQATTVAPTTTTQATPSETNADTSITATPTTSTAFTTTYTTGTDAATTTNNTGSTAGTTAITTAETNATNNAGTTAITTAETNATNNAGTTAITTAETNATNNAGTTAITTAETNAGTTTITAAETNATNNAVTPLSPVPMDYVRCVLALLLFSRLCFLGGWSVQFITPVQRNVAKILFVLELASKIIAFILVLIRAKKYPSVWQCAGFRVEFTALTGIAMVLSLLHTITIFLFCGPSHELRKCWLCAAIVVHLLNTCITTATIFVGVWCFQGRWLPILMGAYVIWEILLHLISLRCDQIEKKQIRRHTGGIQNQGMRRRILQSIVLGVFSVFNIMFTIALITGVFVTSMVLGLD
ncbi:putative ferric-chelate reductase 1 isoform X2 [Triplophysa rosa]|uniref:putative ferric-chelate reductase 1 isoform X2 n=1 Tax=Triplophysa rosa TaxID=992332 RepID=UPI00254632EC|nr:putative ferric-chelate reductase 1 isoform X2 [Triplophysa rosa]